MRTSELASMQYLPAVWRGCSTPGNTGPSLASQRSQQIASCSSRPASYCGCQPPGCSWSSGPGGTTGQSCTPAGRGWCSLLAWARPRSSGYLPLFRSLKVEDQIIFEVFSFESFNEITYLKKYLDSQLSNLMVQF